MVKSFERVKLSFMVWLCNVLKSNFFRKLINPRYSTIKSLSEGKVCIVPGAGNRLGDMIMRNHGIQKIQQRYSVCHAMPPWFYERHKELLENHSFVSNFIILPTGFLQQIRSILILRKQKIDAVLFIENPVVSELYFYLAGVPVFGGVEEFKKLGWSSFTTHYYNLQKHGIHYTSLAPCILDALCGESVLENFDPFFPFKKEPANYLNMNEGINLSLHMGGQSYWMRKWSFDNYLELIRLFLDFYKGTIFLVGGPEEFSKNEELKEQLEQELDIQGRLLNFCGSNLNEFANILSNADIFIGNDSGPMHMATAVNTRVICIFGPSRDELVGPSYYNDKNITIKSGLECAPCGVFTCKLSEDNQYNCLTSIQVNLVWQKLQEAIRNMLKEKEEYETI